MLVLRGEWNKLPQANKTHLNVTLQNTISNLSNTPAYNLCQHVIRVVNNPWNDPTLKKIIDGETISDSEGKQINMSSSLVCSKSLKLVQGTNFVWRRCQRFLPSGSIGYAMISAETSRLG